MAYEEGYYHQHFIGNVTKGQLLAQDRRVSGGVLIREP